MLKLLNNSINKIATLLCVAGISCEHIDILSMELPILSPIYDSFSFIVVLEIHLSLLNELLIFVFVATFFPPLRINLNAQQLVGVYFPPFHMIRLYVTTICVKVSPVDYLMLIHHHDHLATLYSWAVWWSLWEWTHNATTVVIRYQPVKPSVIGKWVTVSLLLNFRCDMEFNRMTGKGELSTKWMHDEWQTVRHTEWMSSNCDRLL